MQAERLEIVDYYSSSSSASSQCRLLFADTSPASFCCECRLLFADSNYVSITTRGGVRNDSISINSSSSSSIIIYFYYHYCILFIISFVRYLCDRFVLLSSPGVADNDDDVDDDGAMEVQTNFVSSQNYTTIITTKLNNK